MNLIRRVQNPAGFLLANVFGQSGLENIPMMGCWFFDMFSALMSKEWRNLGKKTTMRSGSQISPPTGHLPRNGNLGEALAQLLEKTNEAQWPWQK